MSEFVTASGTRYRSHADYMGDLPRLLAEAKAECEIWKRNCEGRVTYMEELERRVLELQSHLKPRRLDVNKDAMVLFLEAAERRGFVIQLVPPSLPKTV